MQRKRLLGVISSVLLATSTLVSSIPAMSVYAKETMDNEIDTDDKIGSVVEDSEEETDYKAEEITENKQENSTHESEEVGIEQQNDDILQNEESSKSDIAGKKGEDKLDSQEGSEEIEEHFVASEEEVTSVLGASGASSPIHSCDEAVAWAVGHGNNNDSLDWDGEYGAQCVDLICYYYDYLGVTSPGGNAIDYADNSLPTGWIRITGDYQSGDIAVFYANYNDGTYSTGSYGHVAIITGTDDSKIITVDQNGWRNKGYCMSGNSYPKSEVKCVIRPNWDGVTGDGDNIVQNEPYAADSKYKKGDIINYGHRLTNRTVDSTINNALKNESYGLHIYDDRVFFTDGKGKSDSVKQTYPIRWFVLNDNGESLLLISEYAMWGSKYSDEVDGHKVNWSTSYIRKDLNSTSTLNEFFFLEEQNDVLPTTIASHSIITDDKLFIPSVGEINTYLSGEKYLNAKYIGEGPNITTPNNYAYDKTNYTCAYWTRNADHLNYGMSQPTWVGCDGTIRYGGNKYCTWDMGIRPMMRIDRDSQYISKAIYESEIPNPFAEDEIVMESGKRVIPFNRAFTELLYPNYLTEVSVTGSSSGSLLQNLQIYQNKDPKITVKIYGITRQPITYEKSIVVIPRKEEISAEYSSKDKTVELSWSMIDSDSNGGYEILRSESENGEYEILYSGYKYNFKTYYDKYHYIDSSIKPEKTYWYKIRGLFYDYENGGLVDTYKGHTSQFSNIQKVSTLTNTNGLRQEADGSWSLYSNGAIATGYTDLYYDDQVGWWLVRNGKVDFEYNGLFGSPTYGWWKITGGSVDFGYNDLCNDSTVGWWKVVGGTVDFGYYDIYDSPSYGKWLINGGAVDFAYNGRYTSNTYGEWEISGGNAVRQISGGNNTAIMDGLAPSTDGNWYLYQNGMIVTDFNDLYCDPNLGWWKIRNGAVDFDYTDLYYSPAYGWWKISGGAVDFGFTDLYCSPVYGWWLIAGGTVAFDYYDLFGSPTYGWWKVNGGAVDFGFTDLYCSPSCGWWLVNGGTVAFDYTDLFYSPTYGWWKINGGCVDFGYTGWYNSPTYGNWNIGGGAVLF